MDKGVLIKLVYAAWLSSLGFQVVLGGVLIGKRMWRQYPVFTAYSLFCFFQAALGFALRHTPQWYFYTYLLCESIGYMLGLGVLYEIYAKLLAPYPALTKTASTAFKWTLVLLISIAAAVIYFHAAVQGSRLLAGFLVLEQATRIAEVGLVVFLFSFSSIFGLHWRQSIFGIALGLGLFITVELVGVTMRTHFGNVAMNAFAVARTLSFNFSLMIWLGYLLAPERVTTVAELPKRAQLEQWNQAIMELIHQ